MSASCAAPGTVVGQTSRGWWPSWRPARTCGHRYGGLPRRGRQGLSPSSEGHPDRPWSLGHSYSPWSFGSLIQPLVVGSLTAPLAGGQPSPGEVPAAVIGAAKDESSPFGGNPVRECPAATGAGDTRSPETDATRQVPPCGPRPVIKPLSPERYRVQFTIGQEAHDILRRLQTLLRREIPDGDAGAIFERALRLLHGEVEAARFGRTTKVKDKPPNDQKSVPAATPAYEDRIRPGADPRATSSAASAAPGASSHLHWERRGMAPSRYIPKAVRRAVWYRDRGQCAFVSASGQRCVEQEFLELHHLQPYALNGPATITNIALRCRLHNAYEAEVIFGARGILRHRQSERHEPPG